MFKVVDLGMVIVWHAFTAFSSCGESSPPLAFRTQDAGEKDGVAPDCSTSTARGQYFDRKRILFDRFDRKLCLRRPLFRCYKGFVVFSGPSTILLHGYK
ncbi:hypothetical protein BDQ17DRAFT_712852 [Cyathus striatus]|nr:hypothetical protein BDQ17DRAFT_712852 [Cyathus striatus]